MGILDVFPCSSWFQGCVTRRASREGFASISSISVCIIYRLVRLIKCISASTCEPIYRACEAAGMEPPHAALLKTSRPPSFGIPHLFVSVSHLLLGHLQDCRRDGDSLCILSCLQFAPKAIPTLPQESRALPALPYPAVPLKESILFPFLLVVVLLSSWLRDCRKQQPDCFVPSLRDCSVGVFFKQNTHLLRGCILQEMVVCSEHGAWGEGR